MANHCGWDLWGNRIDPNTEYWYRFDSHRVSAGVDEFDNPVGPGYVEVYKHEYPVIKHTPKGAWLSVYGEKRFVLRECRKKFAAPTVELALQSFIERKKRQIRILSGQISDAEAAILRADYRYGDPEKRKEKGLEWLASLQ